MSKKSIDPECLGWHDKKAEECRKCLCNQRCESHTKTKNGLKRQAEAAKAMASGGVAPTVSKSKTPPKEVVPYEAVLAAFRSKLGAWSKDETSSITTYKFSKGGDDVLWFIVLKSNHNIVRVVAAFGKKDFKLSSQEDVKSLLDETGYADL